MSLLVLPSSSNTAASVSSPWSLVRFPYLRNTRTEWTLVRLQKWRVRASAFPILFSHVFTMKDVCYRPPGTQFTLLNEINLSLSERSLGLIFGRSGSGKTTLLQLLAGISKPTSGSIYVQECQIDGNASQPPKLLHRDRVGIVFQFPERYFLADTLIDEIIFGWSRKGSGPNSKEDIASRIQRAISWVGLDGIDWEKDPHCLSGGYKRRLALAIQLVQMPDLLILDEPLAGLDWKARGDIVKLLKHLKKDLTILVVSHDLKELAGLVDKSWRMEMGGFLKEEPLQFDSGSSLDIP